MDRFCTGCRSPRNHGARASRLAVRTGDAADGGVFHRRCRLGWRGGQVYYYRIYFGFGSGEPVMRATSYLALACVALLYQTYISIGLARSGALSAALLRFGCPCMPPCMCVVLRIPNQTSRSAHHMQLSTTMICCHCILSVYFRQAFCKISVAIMKCPSADAHI